MTRRRIILLSGILIFLGAVIASILLSRRGREADEVADLPSEQVRVLEVNNREIPTYIEITGRLAAEDRIDIYSEVGGVLLPTTPAFRPGNTFSQGQVLIRIDDSEFRQNLIASRSSFLRSITMLMPDIRLDFSDNYENWLSYLEQFDVNRSIPSLPEPATSQERYFLTGRNIYTQYHEIRQMELRLNKYRIRAPFNGTVTEALITQGTLVMQGQRLGQF
ncbi:MAG: efflux RND transporter periplasmic adaptor subunit, partial [Cytophagaceae bacterium]